MPRWIQKIRFTLDTLPALVEGLSISDTFQGETRN